MRATRMIDGASGRFIAHVQVLRQNYWMLFEHEAQPIESLPIIGSTLVDVLTAILDTGEPPLATRMLGDVVRRRMP